MAAVIFTARVHRAKEGAVALVGEVNILRNPAFTDQLVELLGAPLNMLLVPIGRLSPHT